MPLIAPSLLAANFLQLEKECIMLNESEADWFHLDVMDGQFVPNISFGIPVIQQIRKATTKFCDVHLMIIKPERLTEAFYKAGADSLTIHIEACPRIEENIRQIRSLGIGVGVAINPDTPIGALEPVITKIDIVCLMSVYPGFGGQTFLPNSLERIKELRQMIDECGAHAKIEVDGGVLAENAKEIVAAGADVLVAGSTVFNATDPKQMIRHLKHL